MVEVYATEEKVYIQGTKGCIARLCIFSAEFYTEHCSFEEFQEETKLLGFSVREKHRPKWAQRKRLVMETINTNEIWIEFQEKCAWYYKSRRGANICTKGEGHTFTCSKELCERITFTCSKELCERIKK